MSIMNGIDLTRLSRILAPNMHQQPQVQQPQMPSDIQGINGDMLNGSGNGQDDQLNAALLQLLSPKDEQYDRFTQMLQQMPQRDQYEPTKGRRIAAALMGLGTSSPGAYVGGKAVGFKADIPGSLKVQQSVLDEPYNTALSDWSGKAGNTLEAAKLENTRNVNSRVTGSNIKSAQLREQGLDRQVARDAQIKSKEDAETLRKTEDQKIKKQRADAYVYKTMHPNHKFVETFGLIYSIDPVTGAAEVVKDSEGDPIESDKLGDEAKDMLQLSNAKELESIRQGNRTDLENTRELNRQKDITARGAIPSKTATKTETAANRQTRLYNKAIEGINKHPEWTPYIAVDKVRKVFKVDTPAGKSGGVFGKATPGGDPKVRDEIVKFIYGEDPSDSAVNKPAPKAPKGWKYVAKPGGGWTAVEDK